MQKTHNNAQVIVDCSKRKRIATGGGTYGMEVRREEDGYR
jgi:signal recognition particle GTPase